MIGYNIVNLDYLIETIGEDETTNIISDFSSPLNIDVEKFLKEKSITFSKSHIAKTHLVFTMYKGERKIAGYFAIAGAKYFVVKTSSKAISKTLKRRLLKFGVYNADLQQITVPAPLIGQLGKNFKYPNLITGDELLDIACNKIKDLQVEMGGCFVYLECENTPKLIDFYIRNGFINFGERFLDPDEDNNFRTSSLVQLLKKL